MKACGGLGKKADPTRPTDLLRVAGNLGHEMGEFRRSGIAYSEPRGGLYSLCRRCGRSAWTHPDLQGGHGTAVTHPCD